jgi:hypothetical protein
VRKLVALVADGLANTLSFLSRRYRGRTAAHRRGKVQGRPLGGCWQRPVISALPARCCHAGMDQEARVLTQTSRYAQGRGEMAVRSAAVERAARKV